MVDPKLGQMRKGRGAGEWDTHLMRLLESQGTLVVSCIDMHTLSSDKWETSNRLAKRLGEVGVYTPATTLAENVSEQWLKKCIFESIYLNENPKYYLVVKERYGSEGKKMEFLKKDEKNHNRFIGKRVLTEGKTETFYIEGGYRGLTSYLRKKGNRSIVQSFAPAVDDSGNIYDFRIVYTGVGSGGVMYMRIKKGEEALVPNIAQGGKANFDIPNDQQNDVIKYMNVIYKVTKKIVGMGAIKEYVIEGEKVYFVNPAETLKHDFSLIGFDVGFLKARATRLDKDTIPLDVRDEFLPLLSERKYRSLIGGLEKWREKGKICTLYEINARPAMKGLFLSGKQEYMKKLASDLAEELARLCRVK